MELFSLRQPVLWGDYGDTLISGYCSKESPEGPVFLERTGPFLPPISFPAHNTIIVSEELKSALEALPFTGVEFRKAFYKKIIRVNWHLWDRNAEQPKERPDGGEPENYVLEKAHSAKMAKAMETPWELVIPEFPCVFDNMFTDPENPHRVRRASTIMVAESKYPDIFRSTLWGDAVVSPHLKDWLQSKISEWVKFCPLVVVHDPAASRRLDEQREFYERISAHLTDEEYMERALALCKKHSYAVPDGLSRDGATVSRYCVVCIDARPAKLSAKSFSDYHSIEEYINYRKRVSPDEDVLSTIRIHDLEAGGELKYLGNHQFGPAGTV